MKFSEIPADVLGLLRTGTAIPAHLLALDANRLLDTRRQRALTRYYLDAGSGGLAVGVHATQFAIRDAGLYESVLKLAAVEARSWVKRPVLLVGGVSGKTAQAKQEAAVARGLGYHAGMLSLAPMKGASVDELIAHCASVAAEIPLVGFYLQPAVGGIHLPAEFWRRFCGIENVIAIKIAPFNRYRTLDVAKGLVAAHAEERVTLYTGNDDHIVLDLLVPLAVRRGKEEVRVRIKGGLLGHWSVWTKRAVELLEKIKNLKTIRKFSPWIRKSPTPTARSSMSRTISPAASRAATRCCDARACSRVPGASIQRKFSRRGRPRRSTASMPPIRK